MHSNRSDGISVSTADGEAMTVPQTIRFGGRGCDSFQIGHLSSVLPPLRRKSVLTSRRATRTFRTAVPVIRRFYETGPAVGCWSRSSSLECSPCRPCTIRFTRSQINCVRTSGQSIPEALIYFPDRPACLSRSWTGRRTADRSLGAYKDAFVGDVSKAASSAIP